MKKIIHCKNVELIVEMQRWFNLKLKVICSFIEKEKLYDFI